MDGGVPDSPRIFDVFYFFVDTMIFDVSIIISLSKVAFNNFLTLCISCVFPAPD